MSNEATRFKKGNTIGKETRFKKGQPKTPGSGRKRKTPQELQLLFEEYLKRCAKTKKGLTVQGICKALGMDRSTFHRYYKSDPAYDNVIKRIYIEIEEWWTQYGLTGKATAFVIFYLKNFFGWKDDRSLRLGGFTEEEGNEPIKIITTVASLKDAVSGGIDTESETE